MLHLQNSYLQENAMTKRAVKSPKTSQAAKLFKEPKLTKSAALLLRNAVTVSEEELWAYKRARQKRDIELVESGRRRPEDMSIFPPGAAKRAKILNGPY